MTLRQLVTVTFTDSSIEDAALDSMMSSLDARRSATHRHYSIDQPA